ncbi:MAG: NAD(P)H-dependent glycerol-3-phosphate dehydrogenase [Parvularculaceae bacterium]
MQNSVAQALRAARKPKTMAGLSGLGDLILTATSWSQSRNMSLGLELDAGEISMKFERTARCN